MLWRGSLLPLEAEGLPIPTNAGFGVASQPNGSKLPRHKGNHRNTGKLVVDLISDNATIELTS